MGLLKDVYGTFDGSSIVKCGRVKVSVADLVEFADRLGVFDGFGGHHFAEVMRGRSEK